MAAMFEDVHQKLETTLEIIKRRGEARDERNIMEFEKLTNEFRKIKKTRRREYWKQ